MNKMYFISGILLLILISSFFVYNVSAAYNGGAGGGSSVSGGTGTSTSGTSSSSGGGNGGKNYLAVNNLDVFQKFRLGMIKVSLYNIVPVIDTIGEGLETKFRVNFDAVFKKDVYVSENLVVESLKGALGSGNAYVCITENGVLFRSNDPCR
ncbi:hypothetical protein J4214_00610 [Candidatus Woesearchaeota archaeon]|nr:hypothetical protein [Candidatus Woesearchaeota archaeon]